MDFHRVFDGPPVAKEPRAGVVKLVDAPDSKSGGGNSMGVRLPPPAPFLHIPSCQTAPDRGERSSEMKPMLVSVILLLLLVGSAMAIPPAPWEADELIGKEAPGFVLSGLSGESVSLKDHKGKVVIVNFWATWCPPCRMEIPGMNELYGKLGEKGLVIIGISSDPNIATIEKYLESQPINFIVLHDPDNRVAEKDYKVYSLPTSYVIDRDGVLIRKIFGAYDWASKESFDTFSKLLEKKH